MHPSITIVPIGPNSPSLLTLESADLLRTSPRLILRTDHHPVAAWLRAQNLPFTSLDDLYEYRQKALPSMKATIEEFRTIAEEGEKQIQRIEKREELTKELKGN